MTHGKRGIVMVAELDSQVRRAVMSDLRKAGYTPVGCRDTTGALTYLALGERLDALVSGSGASGDRDGVDLAREAIAARPRLSVIYLSDLHPVGGRSGSLEFGACHGGGDGMPCLETLPGRMTSAAQRLDPAECR